jgi:hydrogenase maturation protease
VNNRNSVKPTLIIGVGNEFRCDDAAGIFTARKLKELLPEEITVLESDGDGAKLMDLWNGHSNVILIDAVSFGTAPGTVHVINANEKEFPKETAIHSSHMFSVPEAIETSRVLNRLPEKIIIYGIEGKSYEMGNNVSDEITKSVEKVVFEIQKEITN